MSIDLSDIRKKLVSMVGPTSKVIEILSDVVSLSINNEDKSLLKVDIFDSIDGDILLSALKRIIKKENIVNLDITINRIPTVTNKGKTRELDTFISSVLELETNNPIHTVSLSGGEGIIFKPFFIKANPDIKCIVDNFIINDKIDLTNYFSDLHITSCDINTDIINIVCENGILLERNTFNTNIDLSLKSTSSDNIIQNNIFHAESKLLCYSNNGSSNISSTFLSQNPVTVQLVECAKPSSIVLDISSQDVESVVRLVDCSASIITGINGIGLLEAVGKKCDVTLMSPVDLHITNKTKLIIRHAGKVTISGNFIHLTGNVTCDDLIFTGGTIEEKLDITTINTHTIINKLVTLVDSNIKLDIITAKYDEIECTLPTGNIKIDCNGGTLLSKKNSSIDIKYDISTEDIIISDCDLNLSAMSVVSKSARLEKIRGKASKLTIDSDTFRCSDVNAGYVDILTRNPIYECVIVAESLVVSLKGIQDVDSTLNIIAETLSLKSFDRGRITSKVKELIGISVKNSFIRLLDNDIEPRTKVSFTACKNSVVVTPYERGSITISGSQKMIVLTQSYQQHRFIINDLITRLWVSFKNNDTLDELSLQTLSQINAIELISELDINTINKFVGWNALTIKNVKTII